MTKYAKKHPYLLISGIIIIIIILLALFGYRLQPNLRIQKNGNMEMTLPLASTTVYINSKKVITTSTEGEKFTKSLRVRKHEVIVSRPGYFPWMKTVEIYPDTTTTLNPVFVTQNTTGQIVTQNDPDYWNIRVRVEQEVLPTKDSPRTQDDSLLWVENNTIYVQTSQTLYKVLTAVDTVRSVDFYKDRTDVVVFAADTGVYAIDMIEDAPNNKANFFPIYKGTKPLFEKTDPSFIYVVDGANLMMVVI